MATFIQIVKFKKTFLMPSNGFPLFLFFNIHVKNKFCLIYPPHYIIGRTTNVQKDIKLLLYIQLYVHTCKRPHWHQTATVHDNYCANRLAWWEATILMTILPNITAFVQNFHNDRKQSTNQTQSAQPHSPNGDVIGHYMKQPAASKQRTSNNHVCHLPQLPANSRLRRPSAD